MVIIILHQNQKDMPITPMIIQTIIPTPMPRMYQITMPHHIIQTIITPPCIVMDLVDIMGTPTLLLLVVVLMVLMLHISSRTMTKSPCRSHMIRSSPCH
jgi:hypothetical protein